MLNDLPSSCWRLIEFEERMEALYHCFDIFVHVPVDADVEAFGQVYIEALAAGIPCIFTASGIANEIQPSDEVCKFVPYRDEQAIFLAIKNILMDEGFKEKGNQSGYEYAMDRFSVVALDKNLIRYYK
jgi:glycosyltransferase involved in cell wall biosynthesis